MKNEDLGIIWLDACEEHNDVLCIVCYKRFCVV